MDYYLDTISSCRTLTGAWIEIKIIIHYNNSGMSHPYGSLDLNANNIGKKKKVTHFLGSFF